MYNDRLINIESNHMVLGWNKLLIVVIFSLGFCLAQLNPSTHNCFDGPDFWCLNDKTESVCNFTNKTIGVCGYSSKRCPVATGIIILFLFIIKIKKTYLFLR